MTDPFCISEDYELFLYANRALPLDSSFHPHIHPERHSLARVSGEIFLAHEIRLVVLERLVFDRLPILIEGYGYEVWKGEEKLYWYDPQPHPNEPSL